MQKIIITLTLILIIYITIGNIFSENNVIPNDSIRLRVIANSNTNDDQQVKIKVKELLQSETTNLLTNVTEIEEARNIIKINIPIIENKINELLKQGNYDLDYKINFGQNYFPNKQYKGIKYKEGYYESLVVTLGNGTGHNWWCVLFPPLCLIEADESDKVEYKSIVQEIIRKYL